MGTILSHLHTSFHIAEKKSVFRDLCVFRNRIYTAIFTRITWVEACLCAFQIKGPMAPCQEGAGTSPGWPWKYRAQHLHRKRSFHELGSLMIIGVKMLLPETVFKDFLKKYEFWWRGNGEYSGQILLFMPQPPKFKILIFVLFFAAFFGMSRCRRQIFSRTVK